MHFLNKLALMISRQIFQKTIFKNDKIGKHLTFLKNNLDHCLKTWSTYTFQTLRSLGMRF